MNIAFWFIKILFFCISILNILIIVLGDKMTQKELSYFEDAIGHEDSIISIITESIKQLEDNNLISFLENELSEHTLLREKLMNKLEEKNA